MYSDKKNINILTAMLVDYGVKHAVVCPGSRNAALVHNFNECPKITCHAVTDERSAGFVALGLRLKHREMVCVCVTSGTALLNVLPAVAEATYQKQGIIIISADRPQAWIDQLDGQTLPQQGALGRFVASSVTLPEPHDATEEWHCQRLIAEALMAHEVPGKPSVHINVPISEPLFSFTTEALPKIHAPFRLPWHIEGYREVFKQRLCKGRRWMIVIGQMERGTLSADLLHRLEKNFAIIYEPMVADIPAGHTDEMMHAVSAAPDGYIPDFVIYVGGNSVSKRMRQFLRTACRDACVAMCNETGQLEDVSMHAAFVIEGRAEDVLSNLADLPDLFTGEDAFSKRWSNLRERMHAHSESFLPEYSSMLAVKRFEEAYAAGDTVCYANSLAVRLGALYANHYIYCNRGVNGIEGSMSTAAGMSLATDGRVFCVIGDLSFLYDSNALWQQELRGNLRIMLLNNGKGAIFNNLPGLKASPALDGYIAAAHSLTAEDLCRHYGVTYLRATDAASLDHGLTLLRTIDSSRPVLLEVITDADTDSRMYREYFDVLSLAR